MDVECILILRKIEVSEIHTGNGIGDLPSSLEVLVADGTASHSLLNELLAHGLRVEVLRHLLGQGVESILKILKPPSCWNTGLLGSNCWFIEVSSFS